MCSGGRSTPLPDMPPPRAMERLPQRGMVLSGARRQVQATNTPTGTMAPATILGAASSSARRMGVGVAGRGTSANSMGAVSTVLGG
jgi:hypothetical protein